MKCVKCGAELPKGELYCPECGQEVQWVPDYDTLETVMIQQQAAEEEAARQRQRAKESRQRAKEEERRRKMEEKKRARFWLSICGVGAVLLLCLILAVNKMTFQNFDYQMEKATSAYTNKQLDDAFECVNRALELEPDNAEATLLLAKIYVEQGEEETAVSILKSIIKNYPDTLGAYDQLIFLYDKQGEHEAIKELLASCENDEVLKKFDDYLAKVPAISLESGEFTELQTVYLYPADEDDMLFYTLDGTMPSETSEVYTEEGIELDEGEYSLQVIAINKKGMHSDIVSAEYKIELLPPVTPEIAPSSGEYRTATKIQVVNIPDGCKAYYAFDETPTTSSREYTRPVSMPEGEHIFSVIFVDEHGKVSNVASATYAFYNY